MIHAIENALSESHDDPTLFPIHLPIYIRSRLVRVSVGEDRRMLQKHEKHGATGDSLSPLKQLMESTEKDYFQRLIANTGGDIQEICRISGITRSNVYARFEKYDLSRAPS